MNPEIYDLLMALTPSRHIPMDAAHDPAKPPTLEQEVDEWVDALVEPAESQRAANVETILQMRLPVVVELACDLLALRLVRGPRECRGPAIASLKQIGKPSLPIVTAYLQYSTNSDVQLAMTEIVVALIPELTMSESVKLFFELMVAQLHD
jgi:hypothetical protein